jgi:periplasmic divalent cation tolerance protein
MISFFYITAKNNPEAQKLIKSLLKKKLVACINIYKNIDSYFLWKNKIAKSKEVVLMGKTTKKNHNKIIKEVRKLHSYEVPCVIFSTISSGNEDFLKWIKNSIK